VALRLSRQAAEVSTVTATSAKVRRLTIGDIVHMQRFEKYFRYVSNFLGGQGTKSDRKKGGWGADGSLLDRCISY
jgi:hypothetical protein